ncbi:ABC transporter ATP-binding protein [Allobaculum stercoricanis]|uniref:ATP-binding cassette domain-containing protein n=1 Tax=Allobaculum stercoricanis TaxID=174709 RepID=UPI0023EFC242|nr:ABC transporter ATP-binding protein [Allobaculum stercoricanis]
MIELKNICLYTRHPILNDVNYVFSDQKIYGIVAINGSGKTTLFRTMVNLRKAQGGKVLFDHQSVELKRSEVFYFETAEWLDRNLNGYDYLSFVKKLWNSSVDLDEIIETWKMKDFIKIPIKKYSLGMKQRLIIAMYLTSDAKYMIMDEITNGLDEDFRNLFFKVIIDLKRQGKTILLSSHYKDEITEYCDVVLQIKNNQLSEVSL